MKRVLTALVLMVTLFFAFFFWQKKARATSLDDQIQAVTQQLASLQNLLQSKEADYQKAQQQLNNIKTKLVYLDGQIRQKALEVKQGEVALVYQKNLLNERVKSYYKNITSSSVSIMDFLIGENLSSVLQNFFYQKTISDDDKNTIIKIVLYINDLEAKKASLENEQTQMIALKAEVDKQAVVLGTEISSTQQQIAQLSALQKQLIAQKLASLNIPQSAYVGLGGGCSSDLTNGKDPGFSPRIGFFTYGVPNRVGLNQYGAKGRAEAGQSYDQILNAYYQNFQYANVDSNKQIIVNGTNDYGETFNNQSMGLDDYLKHLYEMPSDWRGQALQAQAIAARSYVLAATGNGSSPICPNQHCQEVKQEQNSQAWVDAVNATSGKIMTNGGNPISAYYSSTHGGYVYDSSSGTSNRPWLKNAQDSSSSINNFSDLNNNAYDKDSPWFYCDWGARSQYSNTAWLKTDEVADIANVILLVQKDAGTAEHLYQPDKPNPAGTDTWDAGRVKQELQSRGGKPYNNVNNVSVNVDFGAGRVTGVNVSGDAGSVTFNASDFKNYFNLRAPANIQIIGPLFNVENR